MSRFSDKLNFLVLQEGLNRLNLDGNWCTSKEEAVNSIYLYFKSHGMKLEYICPKCGGELPEVEFCPFCGEDFTGKQSEDTKQRNAFYKNNIPVESAKYGEILVQRFDKPIVICSMDTFGIESWATIKDRLMIPEILIYKHDNREQYTIKDPFSEKRPFKFVRSLAMVEVHKKSLVIYLTFEPECYTDYEGDIEKLNVPLRRLVSKFTVKTEDQIVDAINIILQTFKLSKNERTK